MTSTSEMLCALMEELEQIPSGTFKPNYPVVHGEKELGIIRDETTKKLYGAAMLHRRDEKLARAEAQFTSREDDQVGTLMQAIIENDQTADIFMSLFWLAVRKELQYWKEELGIRKGWVVVEPKKDPINELTKALFGEM